MSEDRIRNTIGECVVGLTRHVMSRESVSHDDAYRMVLSSEVFKLVRDPDTRLFLEPNAELTHLYDLERDHGVDALYEAIGS